MFKMCEREREREREESAFSWLQGPAGQPTDCRGLQAPDCSTVLLSCSPCTKFAEYISEFCTTIWRRTHHPDLTALQIFYSNFNFLFDSKYKIGIPECSSFLVCQLISNVIKNFMFTIFCLFQNSTKINFLTEFQGKKKQWKQSTLTF